jgi:DNA polymerase-3 subunit epsilon
MQPMSKVTVVFDTETTGKPKDYDEPVTQVHNWPRVVQLGMALQVPDQPLQTFKALIKPPNGNAFPIPMEATRIHGITDEMCMDTGMTISDALDQFEFWLGAADVLVAHNLDFDRPVLGCEFVRLKRKPMQKPELVRVCTQKSTSAFVGIPKGWNDPFDPYKWPKLQELHHKLFGCHFEGDHDALADVMATLKCYNRLCELGTFIDTYEFLPFQQ